MTKSKKNDYCWYFNRPSGCKRGVHCKYLHVKKGIVIDSNRGSNNGTAATPSSQNSTVFISSQTSEEPEDYYSLNPNTYCTPISNRTSSKLADIMTPQGLIKNLMKMNKKPTNSNSQNSQFNTSYDSINDGESSFSGESDNYMSPAKALTEFLMEFTNNNNNNNNIHKKSNDNVNLGAQTLSQTPDFCSQSPPKFQISRRSIASSQDLFNTCSQEINGNHDAIILKNKKCGCKFPATYFILFILGLILIIMFVFPLFLWNAKFLEIVDDIKTEIGSIYTFHKGFIYAFVNSVASTTTNAVAETYASTIYGVQGMGNKVAMMFENTGRFAFIINEEVESYFNDVLITSMKDSWVSRVSEGIPLDKGLEYVKNKRRQPGRYPEQFIDDLENVVLDLLHANVREDFFEYKEVGFQNNQLTGHVGIIAVRRYSYKREFDVAFSITSTDVKLEYKRCTRKYLGFGKCDIDIADREIRSKLAKYFQRELILDLKHAYPGKIDIIIEGEEDSKKDIEEL